MDWVLLNRVGLAAAVVSAVVVAYANSATRPRSLNAPPKMEETGRIEVGLPFITDAGEALEVADGEFRLRGGGSKSVVAVIYLTDKGWDNLVGSYEREVSELVRRLESGGVTHKRSSPSHVERLGEKRVSVSGGVVHFVLGCGAPSKQGTVVPSGHYLALNDWGDFIGWYEEELRVLRDLVSGESGKR